MFWPRQVQVSTVNKAVSQLSPHGGHDCVRVQFVTVRGLSKGIFDGCKMTVAL